MQDRQLMNSVIKQHLARSRLRMKKQADKHGSEREFRVGDMVFLKLQPYVQSSLAPRSNQKLAFKFFGPFPVVAKVRQVAYRLQLPPSIHCFMFRSSSPQLLLIKWFLFCPQSSIILVFPKLFFNDGRSKGATNW